jgi:hypothetical protein
LPEAAYEALRQIAFDERRKIHDLLMEGVELALKKRGYPALADMKAKWQSPVVDDAGTPLVIPYTKGEREQTKELGTARK